MYVLSVCLTSSDGKPARIIKCSNPTRIKVNNAMWYKTQFIAMKLQRKIEAKESLIIHSHKRHTPF